MNRFNMLTQLREDIKRGNDHLLNYDKFVLSGIIVHDSNDTKLIDYIRVNFVHLAEMTGRYFLFISFIQTSEFKKSDYCHYGGFVDKNALMVEPLFSNEEEERTIPLLREFLCLPQEGSFLMITENLCSNIFYKIPISCDSIEGQFQLITEYCNAEASGVCHRPADFSRLIKTLQADDYSINASLLDILIDFTSLTSKLLITPYVQNYFDKTLHSHYFEIIRNNGRQIGLNESMYLISKVINDITSKSSIIDELEDYNFMKVKANQILHAASIIEKLREFLKTYQGEDFEDRVVRLYDAIANFYKMFFESICCDVVKIFNKGRNFRRRTDNLPQPMNLETPWDDHSKFLDEYSNKLYKTYCLLVLIVDNFDTCEIDYSGLTIYLGKIVENELNVSVCQMLRCSMGIDMPEYFNKYCENRDDVSVRIGNQNVKLNEAISEGSTKLKAIPMGPLLFAYRTMYCQPDRFSPRPQTDIIEELDSTMFNFLNDYRSNYRNAAAHIDLDSDVTYQGAKAAFKRFLDEFIEKLYNIRIKFSTPKEA